jgi:sortase A
VADILDPDEPAIEVPTPAPVIDPPPLQRRRRQRISRWDRPPEPRDWRWAVGHVGRALITLGLLMFGFVGYQLWGTGIQTARAQDHLKSEFATELSNAGITQDTLGPATSTTTAADTTAPATSDTVSGATIPPTTTPATVLPDTSTTAVVPVQQVYGNVQPGDSLGEIRIPKIDLDFYIVAGVSKANLDDGVGHFPNTPLPGQVGNSALAGHRTSHLAPFGDLDLLRPGDEVQIFTKIGGAYSYIVTDSLVVKPTDYHVVTDSDPNRATLTLITCTPKLSSKQRLVVHATLDTTRGSPVGLPLIYYGQDPSTVSPVLPDEDTADTGDTGVSTTDTASAGSTTPTTGESTSSTTSTPAAVVTTPGTADTTVASITVGDQFADDAFSQGWFDDGAAWPHVIGWAAAFGLVWYAAYRLARRFRNAWLGLAAGIVPVIVVLYFLYENINRLLPAAL